MRFTIVIFCCMIDHFLLTDFAPSSDWQFLKCLSSCTQHNWKVLFAVSNKARKSSFYNILRIAVYFVFPLRVLLKYYRESVVILAVQQFYGLDLAFWLRLFHMKKRSDIYIQV